MRPKFVNKLFLNAILKRLIFLKLNKITKEASTTINDNNEL